VPRHELHGDQSVGVGEGSGIAIIGAIFYGVLGAAPSRGTFVTGMVVAMSVSAVLVAAAAATTLLLPRRTAARPAAGPARTAVGQTGQVPAARPVTAGAVAAGAVAAGAVAAGAVAAGAVAAGPVAYRTVAAPVREQVTAATSPVPGDVAD
jgi:hypothetical protein